MWRVNGTFRYGESTNVDFQTEKLVLSAHHVAVIF